MPLYGERDPATWEQIANKSWEELGVAEHDGYLLFPENLLTRSRDGKLKPTPIMLRVPREFEWRKARIAARKWANDDGLDPRLDADLVDNLETLCTMTLAIRNATGMHEQWITAETKDDLIGAAKILERKYDKASIQHLWCKLDAYAQAVDPRPESFTQEQLLATIAAIAERRDIAPLRAYAGRSESDLVIAMACRLQSFLDPNYSLEPSDSSIAAS